MNVDPPGSGDAEFGDIGEIIRFDVVDHGDGLRVLHAVGELDTLTSPLLQARVAEQLAEARSLVIELLLVGPGLVGAKDDADSRNCRLWLVPGSRIAKRALEATGLLTLFQVADDVTEALAAAR